MTKPFFLKKKGRPKPPCNSRPWWKSCKCALYIQRLEWYYTVRWQRYQSDWETTASVSLTNCGSFDMQSTINNSNDLQNKGKSDSGYWLLFAANLHVRFILQFKIYTLLQLKVPVWSRTFKPLKWSRGEHHILRLAKADAVRWSTGLPWSDSSSVL